MKRFSNFFRYVIVFLLNFVFMVLFHSYVNFVLMIALIAFLIYSVAGVYTVRRNVTVEMDVPMEPMEKKDEFLVRFQIQNRTIFPLVNAVLKIEVENPFYQKDGTNYLNLPVRAFRKTQVSYPIQMDYCGRLVVVVKEIRLTDLSGIVEVSKKIHLEKECLVFPKSEKRSQEAGMLYIKGVSEAMESKEKGYDFSEISGIREYIPGDKLQNIHWKLSVKKDELMVKERVSVSAMQLSVLIELVNNESMELESVLELADSVTKSFVEQNLPFTVYHYSVGRNEIVSTYIGNEIERKEWLAMILYDRCYRDVGKIEELYRRDISSDNRYLYIGYSDGTEKEDALFLGTQTVAVLKG